MHVLSKNVGIEIKFIIAVLVLKTKVALSNIGKVILAIKKTRRHYKSDELNIIYKSGILFVIISAYNWK